jgi:hypothetical protein
MRSAAQLSDPARQPRAEWDLDYRVHRVRCDLEQAARGVDTAYALSNAAESIAAHYRDPKPGQISTEQCDELLTAVARAHLGALQHLPESYPREQIDAGLQALAGQVMLWAETRERSTQRTRHALSDLDAYARMFRNDMHNVSLRDEIDRRAWERRDTEIQKLLRPDHGSKARGA